eukprot:s1104_g2.t1
MALGRTEEKTVKRVFGQSWKNLISIGDGEAEWDALHDLAIVCKGAALQLSQQSVPSARTQRQKELRLKTVKLLEEPTCSLLQSQLQVLEAWLPSIALGDEDISMRLPELPRMKTKFSHCTKPLCPSRSRRKAVRLSSDPPDGNGL